MLLLQHQYPSQLVEVVAVLGIPAQAATVAVRVLVHSYQQAAATELIDKHNTQVELVEPDQVEI
jgi:hypothetical protein